MMQLYRSLLYALIGVMLAIICTGCASKEARDYSNQYNAETDAPYHLLWQGGNQRIVEVDKGYYFLNANYIYYADKATMKPVLLDSNPNSDCLSSNKQPENCSAFVYFSALDALHFLAYYDGALYTLQQAIDLKNKLFDLKKFELVKIAPDGSERSVVLDFEETPYFLSIHRGKLYVTTGRITNPETESYKLLAYDMEQLDKTPEVIFEGNQAQGMISDIFPYGKNIYFRESLAPFANYYRYDLENKTIQKMFSDEEGTLSGYINGIKNNTIIYSLFNGDLLDPESWQARTVTLENQNPQKLDLNPSFLSFYYWHDSDPYLYSFPVLGYDEILDIETKNELTIYDDQYHIVDVIPTPNFNVRTTLYVGNKDHMFAYTKEEDLYKWYILDKRTIEAGNAVFHEWVSTPSVNFSYFIQH